MARILTRDEFTVEKRQLLRAMRTSLFIYPTDTIYGIGCNALDGTLVKKVRALKRRHDLPFSVIAPSIAWIRDQCVIDERAEAWLAKLPGPYTLVLKLKKRTIPQEVNGGLDTLGVRIPDSWFSGVVAELGLPVVTTSANLTGQDHMVSLDDLDRSLRDGVEMIFYDGELRGRPSTIVRLDTEEQRLHER